MDMCLTLWDVADIKASFWMSSSGIFWLFFFPTIKWIISLTLSTTDWIHQSNSSMIFLKLRKMNILAFEIHRHTFVNNWTRVCDWTKKDRQYRRGQLPWRLMAPTSNVCNRGVSERSKVKVGKSIFWFTASICKLSIKKWLRSRNNDIAYTIPK